MQDELNNHNKNCNNDAIPEGKWPKTYPF